MYLDLGKEIPKSMKKPPMLGEYNGKGYPDEHMQFINDRLDYYNVDDASKCKLLELMLVIPARLLLKGLLVSCINHGRIFMIDLLDISPPEKNNRLL